MTDKQIEELIAKIDTLEKKVVELTPKKDASVPKEDARDISIKRGTDFLKSYLAEDLPKEKLDSYSFNDLLVAADLKATMKPAINLNPAPPINKTDAVEDNRPEWLIPTIEGK